MLNQTPLSIKLVDSSGDTLTKDSTCNGMFTITASGAETVYFYLEEALRCELVEIRYMVDAAVTLAFDLQVKSLGAANWQDVPAHSSGVLAADGSSQDSNTNYPLREFKLSGMEMRCKCVTGGAAVVGCQVMVVLK